MEWLKEYAKSFVNEEQLESFVEGFKKEFPKHAALKSDFNKRGEEIDSLTKQLETVNAQVTELKEKGNPNDEMKKMLDNLTQELEAEKTNSKKREEQWGMKEKLKSALGKSFNEDSVDLLLGTFNLDEMTVNEAGDIVDLQAKIDRLKESRPSLVKDFTPDTPPAPDRNTPETVDTSKMTDAEYYEWKSKQE